MLVSIFRRSRSDDRGSPPRKSEFRLSSSSAASADDNLALGLPGLFSMKQLTTCRPAVEPATLLAQSVKPRGHSQHVWISKHDGAIHVRDRPQGCPGFQIR